MSQIPQSLIVGPGAIGSLLCAHIQNYTQVWVYRHKPTLVLPKEAYTTGLTPLNWHLLENDQQSIDLIWVCCKADHSLSTTTHLLSRFKHSTAVLLHNGMGPQHPLAAKFPGRVIFAMTTNGVFKEGDQLFHQKAFGVTNLGYPDLSLANDHDWVSTIASWPGNMDFQADNQITSSLWRKLAMNAVINPLTAFYQIKNGELAKPSYKKTIEALCVEIAQIAHAEAISLPRSLTQTVYDVIKLTADNYSSMQQDVQQHRKTEIDFILGFMLECAQKHQINAPNLQHWYQAILSCHDTSLE